MRILHTSDWHLGRVLHSHALLDDQRHMLSQVLDELKSGYDALVVAGDVFDRAIPSAAAMSLLDDFLNRVCKLDIPVVMIPGNHDSAERLGYGASLFERHGIHIRCGYAQFMPLTIKGDDGEALDIFTMPFVDHAFVKEALGDDGIVDKESAVKALLDGMRAYRRADVPSMLVTHEFIAGAEESESERVFIGGSHVVPASLFDSFAYVALGHLHKFQPVVGGCRLHYCGSPLAYSFSEANNRQGMSSVSITNGHVEIKQVPIAPLRKMAILEDSFDALLENPAYERHTDDYVSVRITDEGHHLNLQARLRERFPHLLETRLCAVERRLQEDSVMVGTSSDAPAAVFGAFLDYFKWTVSEERAEAECLFGKACEAARQMEVAQ